MHFCKAIDILFPTGIERSYANAFYMISAKTVSLMLWNCFVIICLRHN